MDSGASTFIIHYSFYVQINVIREKLPQNKWSAMAGSISKSWKGEVKIKPSVFNITAHIFALFNTTSQKSSYNAIFGQD